jgi:hypothetical protein
MEVTPAERAAALVALVFLVGLLIMDIDILTGGRLFGPGPSVPDDDGLEAGEDDGNGRGV